MSQVSADEGHSWGSVCFHPSFGAAEATIACRQMGLGTLGLPRTATSYPGFAASAPQPPSVELPTLLNVQQRRVLSVSLVDFTGHLAPTYQVAAIPVVKSFDIPLVRALSSLPLNPTGTPLLPFMFETIVPFFTLAPVLQRCKGDEQSLEECSCRPFGDKPGCAAEDGMAGVVCLAFVRNTNNINNNDNSAMNSTLKGTMNSTESSAFASTSASAFTSASSSTSPSAFASALASTLASTSTSAASTGVAPVFTQAFSSAFLTPSTASSTASTDSSAPHASSSSVSPPPSPSIPQQPSSHNFTATEGSGDGWGGSGGGTAAAANVVCRQLGYIGGSPESAAAVAAAAGWTGAATAPLPLPAAVLSGISCTGEERVLLDCAHSAWGDAGACIAAESDTAAATAWWAHLMAVRCYREPPGSQPQLQPQPQPDPKPPKMPTEPSRSPPPVYSPHDHHQQQHSPRPMYTPPYYGGAMPLPLPASPENPPTGPGTGLQQPTASQDEPPSVPPSQAPTVPPLPIGPGSTHSPMPASPPQPLPSPPSTPPAAPRLPPLITLLVAISADANQAPTPALSGLGFVTSGGDLKSWSYLCGDPWAGWDSNAANTACRQAGYIAGGDPLRIWRSDALPQLLPGTLRCNGQEASLSGCDVTAPPGAIEAWMLGVFGEYGGSGGGGSDSGGCQALAAVRCRGEPAVPSSVILRAAARPAPSGRTFATASAGDNGGIGFGGYGGSSSTSDDTAATAGVVFIARLEASVGNGPFGAVCLDDGFNDVAAAVACRDLGYPAGGVVYTRGAAKGSETSARDFVQDPTLDARGSFLGTLSSVRCSGTGNGGIAACASWRADLPSDMIPCHEWLVAGGYAAVGKMSDMAGGFGDVDK
ncbi:hypothetical protein VOLCADRAFT_92506 [Volvox carteri f. nagariensis]|uniref:SRCR domain-containing protein n=1 Tax=Volvox carteri f. nagariensis TaxID=3068 RepID=D8TZU4_VOLCA|nr:uncharacterized protein VOLCADRAFT_92506 [Volvox carteri f. nagariensis]EFJ47077.1 hypothetical protein VOLCADRAFT_92506 [Volvox carteri f. nagariensis]|eukprot:XP_002951972.1 hypothetical protein VOLCADRAFT_92506 [Volvox carteri f. nagariensis]